MALVSLSHPSTSSLPLLLPSSASPSSSSHLLPTSRGGRRLGGCGLVAVRQGVRWRAARVSSFSFQLPSFFTGNKKEKDDEKAARLKEELLTAIAPLERGAEATPEDQERVEQIAQQLEEVNPAKEPLKSDLLNGKWELLYTTSTSILQPQRPKFLRPYGTIYQSINTDTLRAQNMETWPYFNQWIPFVFRPLDLVHNYIDGGIRSLNEIISPPVTANLVPLNSRRVAVRFDYFKIFSLIPIKAPGRGKGELEITYLDEDLRVSRGDKGNLFVLKMVDPTYRVPL